MALYQVNSGDRILAADLNQFYNILKGVAASGESVTLIYNAAGVLVAQPSSDPAAGTELIQVKNNAGTVQSALSSDGRAYLSDGLVGTPSHAFESEKTTGLYRISAGVEGFAILGVERVRLSASGLSLDGGTTFLPPTDALDNTTRWSWYWTPGMTIESTLTGTGAYSVPAGFVHGQLSCGATSGSNVGLRMTVPGPFAAGNSGTSEIRYWSFTLATDKAAAEAWRIFLTDESVTGQPSLTAKHLGVRFDGTTANFSTADGATEQTTDVTAQFTANTTAHLVITFDGTTAKLYIDGTLRATHATNVPTTAAGVLSVFRAHITNSAAADKLLYLASMQVRGVA